MVCFPIATHDGQVSLFFARLVVTLSPFLYRTPLVRHDGIYRFDAGSYTVHSKSLCKSEEVLMNPGRPSGE